MKNVRKPDKIFLLVTYSHVVKGICKEFTNLQLQMVANCCYGFILPYMFAVLYFINNVLKHET